MEKIIIKDAYEHNLKHIDLEIPLNTFTCVTGCSGCGKSSLVFDTIYAESQRGFLEGMTGNLYGQKLMNKPKVKSIENLQPALNISQNYYNVNPRSTIGTITEISYYLRSLFAIVNTTNKSVVNENIFSSNNPKSFCPNCMGLGVETIVSEDLLIPDKEKTLNEGGILFFKGSADSKEHKTLEAFCEHYGIDIDKKISELTEKELNLLLYADDDVRSKISYKEGKRRKQHFVDLKGAVTTIQQSITNSEQPVAYSKYMEEAECHVCHGTKLNPAVLSYKVGGLNYSEVEKMELKDLKIWLQNLPKQYSNSNKIELINQLIDDMIVKIDSLISLNVGYLCLNRSIPTLSDGERQRIRIATQLTCSLKGILYILDEPCKGLHHRDIPCIIKATNDLIDRGNTVIAIEHNKQYISAAKDIIELGPVGGPAGGYLIEPKSNFNLNQSPFKKDKSVKIKDYCEMKNIQFRNIKGESVRFPISGITCITGVSGSGKSTLASVILNCFESNSPKYCQTFSGGETIKRIIPVNQAPVGKTPRSTVVSYLGIFDEIRSLFANAAKVKKIKLGPSDFSMNVKGGRCECCQGTGLQKIELNYLPSMYVTCPECEGSRYNDSVLSVEYKGLTILDILETPVSELLDKFKDTKKVYSILQSMIELGLGYLKLGQMSMNLSGGEAQRIKLAKALGTSSHGSNLYILDEPTSGLNDVDIYKFINIILSLQKKGDTIIIIEHNISFIKRVADYIIDFGIRSGNAGGKVMSQGSAKDVFKDPSSSVCGLE